MNFFIYLFPFVIVNSQNSEVNLEVKFTSKIVTNNSYTQNSLSAAFLFIIP